MSLLLALQGPAGVVLSADPGSYIITGFSAELLVGRALNAEPATYLLAGATAELLVGRLLGADPGIYLLTGSPATLDFGAGAAAAPFSVIRLRTGGRLSVGLSDRTLARDILSGLIQLGPGLKKLVRRL